METINCTNCGQEVEKYPSEIDRAGNNFCSVGCSNQYRTGEKNQFWSGGKIESKCIVCETIFEHYESQRTGKYCSPECKSEDSRREEYQKTRHFYNRTAWDNKREEIKERDNNTCQWCKQSDNSSNLHVHHLRPIEFGGAEYDEANLVTLCNRCHGWAHKALKV